MSGTLGHVTMGAEGDGQWLRCHQELTVSSSATLCPAAQQMLSPRPGRPITGQPLGRSTNHSPVTILRPGLSTNRRPGSRLITPRPHLVPASRRLVPVTPMSASMGLSQPIRAQAWGLVTNERSGNCSSGLGARGLTPPK